MKPPWRTSTAALPEALADSHEQHSLMSTRIAEPRAVANRGLRVAEALAAGASERNYDLNTFTCLSSR